MSFSGFINTIMQDPQLKAAIEAQGVNVDPAYQQPMGPNSVTPQTSGGGISGSLNKAVELANIASQTPLVGGSPDIGGGGSAVAVPQQVAPARQPSALMTDRAIVDRFPFAKPVAPGSLGEVFQQMAYQNRPDLAALRQQSPATVPTAPVSRPTGQMMPQMAVPQPTYSPASQPQNTMLSRFLSGRRSGGISDLLQARLGG